MPGIWLRKGRRFVVAEYHDGSAFFRSLETKPADIAALNQGSAASSSEIGPLGSPENPLSPKLGLLLGRQRDFLFDRCDEDVNAFSFQRRHGALQGDRVALESSFQRSRHLRRSFIAS